MKFYSVFLTFLFFFGIVSIEGDSFTPILVFDILLRTLSGMSIKDVPLFYVRFKKLNTENFF